MSANLLDGVSPVLIKGVSLGADGELSFSTYAGSYDERQLVYELPFVGKLDANQTFHFGVSAIADGGTSELFVKLSYSDSAGNTNMAVAKIVVTTTYARHETSLVIPSGMTVGDLLLSRGLNAKHIKIQPPTLSYGGPVTLASSAHTPYATQDHLRSEYATKAALKVTSDAVTAEVTERGKLAGRVGTLESASGTHTSKLEQLAASIKSLVKGESTYTDPDGKSATSGIYSLVTQTRDSVTALFGSYTKTADLASTQAVKDARKAGTDAQAAASAAQTTADSAKSTAQAAASDAATAKTNAASAVSTANSASTSAANAVKTANAASGTASKASTDAASAVKTANAASSNASGAVTTANGAKSTANAANSTAQTAKSTADTAKSTADSAKAAAGSAQSTADAAKSAAATAQSSADAAQGTADVASSTAGAAKSTADSLATMIREDATGITVGKSADGKMYSTGRTHMTADSFDVLDKAGNVLSSFGKNLIELGKNSMDATISMLAGLVKIQARNDGSNTVASISSDFLSLDSLWKAVMRAGKETGGAYVEGYAAAIAEVTGRSGTARLYCTQGNGSRVTANNAFTVLPDGYDLGRPEYLAAALLGTGGGGTGITHSQDAVTMASDLDACGPGVFSYDTSTTSRPTNYGTCVCIRAGDGTTSTWLFQLALPTAGDPHWRRNINGGGWSQWWTITSQ